MQNTLLPSTSDKVEEMTFEPIKGYPMLHWQGKRPFTSTQYYPAQLKERYGDPVDGWMNRIYWGDNLQVMSHLLKEFRGKVDLVYIDPPFDSRVEYKRRIELKSNKCASDFSSFEEKQYSDIWSNDEYLQFIYLRLILIKELISTSGTVYIHTDYHKTHYLRIICDEIFGASNFVNEIIWHYYNKMAPDSKCFPRASDKIIVYSRQIGTHIFNKQTERRDTPAKQLVRKFVDGKAINARDENGNVMYRMTNEKRIDDVWRLSMLQPADKTENLNYPTQKPETILERIISASSNPGSIVFDCFMGSGTTQAAAMKLGRRFIGADINLGAIQTTTKRLNGIIKEKKEERKKLIPENPLYLNFEVYNVNHYDVFRNPVQAKDLLIQALEIDPLESTDLFDGMKDGYLVKIMPVNRIATRADLNPIISGVDYRDLGRKMEQNPGAPAARIMLVCMGHEPELAATLKMEIGTQYRVDVTVVDILRDKQDLVFKYDSEADIAIEGDYLTIKQFYPRNLLQKLSILEENVEEWRELVETVAIDWNYNGEVLRPAVYDSPGKNELVKGRYKLPPDYGQIRVKITDLLSESLEMTVEG